MSKSQMGKKNHRWGTHLSNEVKLKISEGNKGKIVSKETRKKMSNSGKGKKISREWRRKISAKLKNRVFSEEHRKKLSINNARPMLGKHLTDEHKNRISLMMRGSKHPLWLGGKSFEPYNDKFNGRFKNKIRQRDKKCMVCGKKRGFMEFHVHHIDYNKLNSTNRNCICLCCSCHTKTNFNRKHWKLFFRSLISQIYKKQDLNS